jgi:hypothetical protein
LIRLSQRLDHKMGASQGRTGLSFACLSRMTAAVTTFVFTPQTRCTLTHLASSRVTPYFASNQRVNRLVQKPDGTCSLPV